MLRVISTCFVVAFSGSVQAASFNPTTEDPIVGLNGHEVVEYSLWTYNGVYVKEPNPDFHNPSGGIIDGGDENFTRSYFRRCKCSLDFSNLFYWGSGNTVNNYFQHITNLFVDVHKKYYHVVAPVDPSVPEVAPVPLPMPLHMLSALLFGLFVWKRFPQDLIDRPDRGVI